MDKRPYIPTVKPLPAGWWFSPKPYIKRLLDSPDKVYQVHYAPDVLAYAVLGNDADKSAGRLSRALQKGKVATVRVTYPRGGGTGPVRALVHRYVEGGDNVVYEGSARGGGNDKTTAALAGIPLWLPSDFDMKTGTYTGERRPLILTDHCGLDGVAHPWGPKARAIVLSEGLPSDYLVL